MARSVGLKRDLRITRGHNYANYNTLAVKSFCSINGDTYDRYLIRMLEMGESLSIVNIVTKALLKQQKSNYKYTNALFKNSFYKNNTNSYTSMEDLISHFTF